jgi:hypothetical protein
MTSRFARCPFSVRKATVSGNSLQDTMGSANIGTIRCR